MSAPAFRKGAARVRIAAQTVVSVERRELIEEPFIAYPMMKPPLEHCDACGADIDPRDVGEVLFHGLGHNEVYREAAGGLYFIGASAIEDDGRCTPALRRCPKE